MITTTKSAQAAQGAQAEHAETRWTPPRWWFTGARIANAAFFAALAAIVAVPGLEEDTRDRLAATLLAVFALFFTGLWLIVRRGSGSR